MPPKSKKHVICTCIHYGCHSRSYINQFGEQRPGRQISKTARYKHRKKDIDDSMISEDSSTNADKRSATVDQEEDFRSAHTSNLAPSIESRLGDMVSNGIFLPDINGTIYSIADAHAAIYYLACILGSWLHIVLGLSRASTNTAMHMVQLIISLAISMGRLALATELAIPDKSSVAGSTVRIPRDIDTATSKLPIHPLIHRTVICPKCFCKYPINDIPTNCTYRETPRSRPCNEILLRIVRHPKEGAKVIPRRLYSTQDFKSWLEYFLSQPGIEDLIDRSYDHKPNPAGAGMQSIWDSPAWQSIKTQDADGNTFTFSHGRNNLIFSYFIDWFNPHLNKIAGLVSSCGAIMLFCLNLPYEFQHLVQNTYFAGITPPPKEPTITTITSLSDPVIAQFLQAWNGLFVRTHRHPNGIMKRSAILPVIGDIPGIRKCMGYASASAYHFCSFCWLQLFDIGNFNVATWTPKIGDDMRARAELWHHATTKVARKALFKKNGIRWSSLQQLTYRDPVKHTVLGVMHNWIEGVVQHHVRYKWGIGIPDSSKPTTKSNRFKKANPGPATDLMSMEIDSSDMESGSLPSTEHDQTPQPSDFQTASIHPNSISYLQQRLEDLQSQLNRESLSESSDSDSQSTHSSRSNSSSIPHSERSQSQYTPLQSHANSFAAPFDHTTTYQLPPGSVLSVSDVDSEIDHDSTATDNDDEDSDSESGHPTDTLNSQPIFSPSSLSQIREGLAQVVIPSWLERPPTNLGEKSHGKLKADEWLVLASVFFPLIIPEILINTNNNTSGNPTLDNFYHLASCTNIIASHTVSTSDADCYLQHYLSYIDTSKALFPDVSLRPNHHFAVHAAEQMKYWGPLIKLSEYPYEQHNGLLQKIKNNGRLWELDYTMLRKVCQIGRLRSTAQSSVPPPPSKHSNSTSTHYNSLIGNVHQSISKMVTPAASTLRSSTTDKDSTPNRLTSIFLPENYYNDILAYTNEFLCTTAQLPPFRHYQNFPHPLDANVFPRRGWKVNHLAHNRRTFTPQYAHEGNSSISFLNPRNNQIDAGFIQSIWKVHFHQKTYTFLILSPHIPLLGSDIEKNPYRSMPDLFTTIVYTQPPPISFYTVIEPVHIQAHVPFYRRPENTFGFDSESLPLSSKNSIKSSHCLILLDLMIHSIDYSYGLGDEGELGIEQFVKQHVCNAICKGLHLPPVQELWKQFGPTSALDKTTATKIGSSESTESTSEGYQTPEQAEE
ncbi:hypothetical protein CVT24_009827 [Panaeolus cyanescens]|uniref:Alpha-type protein kinase domain-containing protein n=1 Tax=Panaeolus cyanescens TaxID=181874 RepID=A0A409WF78_9AGAR|nr:hypothetical protein CVT24_009827 [Panaeolus cyanescens]